MSTTYNSITGDTFATVSRKMYGSESDSALVASANPGVVEPIPVGSVLVIPDQPSAPQNLTSLAPEEGVVITINGYRFRTWSVVRLTRSIDSVDTLDVSTPALDIFNFKPFGYDSMEVSEGGENLFKGTMVSVDPTISAKSRTLSLSGYSLPGVLNDCTAPASLFPLEFNSLKLSAIAAKLLSPFGLSAVFESDEGAVFDRVAINSNKNVLSFLTELAKQRGLIISSAPNGELLFQKSVSTGLAVATLEEGLQPLVSVASSFNPQGYYSHVTGIEPSSIGIGGGKHTVKNPLLTGVLRPFNFNVDDVVYGGLQAAVEAKAGRMFGDMVTYTAKVASWRAPNGNLWKPNTLLKLTAPSVFIEDPYVFLIKRIVFTRSANAESATLSLTLPGAYSGEIPTSLPWG